MNKILRWCLLLPVMAMIGMQSVQAETIYEGIDKQGNTIFSDKPFKKARQKKKHRINIPERKRQKRATEQSKHLDSQSKARIEKRAYLQRELKTAYAELDSAEQTLLEARARQAKLYRECLDRAGAQRRIGAAVTIQCEPSYLFELEAQVSRLRARVNRIKTELDLLPK